MYTTNRGGRPYKKGVYRRSYVGNEENPQMRYNGRITPEGIRKKYLTGEGL